MNHSICSADRATHLKIVVVALAAAISLAALAISSHITADVASDRITAVIKAGKPVAMTLTDMTVMR
ncbi:hypothetical protein HAP47_0036655 [Bradyrhizobium sp. 41S5]|uniref:hypothetical protein n=1 Tax=Bradyrhizobium sp. 41S5 TaxID=1404443 RepID=UPI00156BD34F|nr:hypothetical protein [Bradyrhizobium sp. 41S5]UFX44461.1 hypothetical protein HAP47_0036655 [Bradyrhizobium sp. 41S5]